MLENDDEYDFNPLDSSKLSSLFGSPPLQTEETSKNLIYTAPKQPSASKSKANTEKSSSTRVIVIKIITLWKSEDETYKPMGKHGLAVIGATDLKAYEIIAYKHKTNTVLRAKINAHFYYHQRRDNFSSFYDHIHQNWLVRFDSGEQQSEFSEHIKLFGGTVIVEDENKSSKPETLPKLSSSNDHSSDSSDSAKKANILHRITKMGHQVVPKPLAVIESDASDEYEISGNKNKKFRKIKKLELDGEIEITKQIVSRPHVSSPQVYYSGYGDLNSILVAHNSELKTSLNQISEKLDTLNVQKKDSNSTLTSRLKVIELKSENLQSELSKYKRKCFDLETKSADVSSLNERLKEANLKVASLSNLHSIIEQSEKTISEQKETIDAQKQSLDELNTYCQQYIETNQENVSTIANLTERLTQYEVKFENIETETRKMVQENNENVLILSRLVKEKMNDMYQSVLNAFDPEESFTLNQIQTVLTRNLKDASYRIINDIKAKVGDVRDDAN